MEKIFDLFLEPQKTSDDIFYAVLGAIALISLSLWGLGWRFECTTLYSWGMNLFVFTLISAVISAISKGLVRKKTEKRLKHLTDDEKNLLFYIYNRSKESTNAVYIPYDNAIAIHLKYRRILRRYDIPKATNSKHIPERNGIYCCLYGIRQLPLDFIKNGNIQYNNPSKSLCAYLDKYQ